MIKQLEIDIAVDLNGFTDGMRPHILARRPAPIQVSYLGYPGTMGAGYIDYILRRRDGAAARSISHISREKAVWLPDSYQVCDLRRPISERTPTRAECGLPEAAFVFCCFNAAYKITPEIFRYLDAVARASLENSVLWLATPNPTASANLRAAAKAGGISLRIG